MTVTFSQQGYTQHIPRPVAERGYVSKRKGPKLLGLSSVNCVRTSESCRAALECMLFRKAQLYVDQHVIPAR